MIPSRARRRAVRSILPPCLAIALLLVAAPTPANDSDSSPSGSGCAEAAARRVQSRYEEIRDLSARFEQRTRPAAFGGQGAPFVARGRVTLAKPGRMRWAYEAPEPSLVVSDGKTVWVYDPAAREAQHLPLGERFLSGAAIQFLIGRGNLLEEFSVSSPACGESPLRLVLVPKRDAPYERLEVRVEPRTGVVVETAVADLLGNVTHVVFEDMRTNQDPEPALFRFEPEPGVKVIELPPAPARP